MLRIGALVSGGGTNLQAVLNAMDSGSLEAEFAIVVSSSKNAYALERARNRGIPTAIVSKKNYENENLYTKELLFLFNSSRIDLIATVGFNQILPKAFVDAFCGRIINVHPTLIPSFCGKGFYGLKVHEAVLSSGVKVTGATVHFVNELPDGGPIILQKPVWVRDGDTPETLQKRVMEEAEWKILPEAIRLFSEGRLKIEGNRVCGADIYGDGRCL